MSGRLAIGIDIGGTHMRGALVSDMGELLSHESTATNRDPHEAAAQIERLAQSLDREGVAAIGLGVPGRVDARRRAVLSGGYVDFSGIDLARELETRFGRPVAVENDATAALIAETRLGAARGRSEVALLTIGTGIGGALLGAGKVVHGAGTAGQLGHLSVTADGVPCVCGRRGCLETESSGTALARHIAEARLPAGTRVEDLLAAAGVDPLAARAVDRSAAPLRRAIDSLVAAFAPELVLLGGGLGGAALKALGRHPATSPWYQAPIAEAALGDGAGVIGAALAGLARAEASP